MEPRTDDELGPWLALFCVPRLSLRLSHKLLQAYQTPTKILTAMEQELRACRVKPEAITAMAEYRKTPEHSAIGKLLASALEWQAREADHHLIHWTHPCYPQALREIAQPPLLLFVVGNAKLLNQPQLAMVGSRSPSIDGQQLAYQFAAQLSRAGFLITSGLAMGIDGASHAGALSTNLPTIAVMATGIDQVYPRKHQTLAEQIRRNGALVSEFPLGQAPRAQHFPQRNRIISGLSLGVLVVEAAIKSGSLITARFALEQNREVFAIPGSTHNPVAKGCHLLIREGAKLVETAEHILEELSLQLPLFSSSCESEQRPSQVTKLQQLVLEKMGFDMISTDLLVERTQLLVTELSATLTELTLLGQIENTTGGFIRTFTDHPKTSN
ncbi:MAG: DNA-processing protein DprA [Pseudomonadales bacterium]